MSEKDKRAMIEEAVKKIDLLNLPPEIQQLLNQISELANDRSFIENMQKDNFVIFGPRFQILNISSRLWGGLSSRIRI